MNSSKRKNAPTPKPNENEKRFSHRFTNELAIYVANNIHVRVPQDFRFGCHWRVILINQFTHVWAIVHLPKRNRQYLRMLFQEMEGSYLEAPA